MRRWLQWLPLTVALVWLLLDGRRFFLDEAQFLIEILVVSFVTRGVGMAVALSALAWGIGLVAPVIVLAGTALAGSGVEMTDGIGNSVIVPIVEEIAKLLPIGIVAILARRWRFGLLNPSDLLLLGCMSGAGFSMVESSYFDTVRTGVRYGPQVVGINLLPTAWGAAGYVGHAAATGLIAVCLGLALHLRRTKLAARWWWAVPVAAFGWIALEHGLANLYVDTGSRMLLVLGAGRITPWLFLGSVAAALAIDARNAAATFTRSKELQKRRVLIRAFLASRWRAKQVPRFGAILAIVRQLRLLNTTAWFDAGRPATTTTEPAP